jgi:hypothetical protein
MAQDYVCTNIKSPHHHTPLTTHTTPPHTTPLHTTPLNSFYLILLAQRGVTIVLVKGRFGGGGGRRKRCESDHLIIEVDVLTGEVEQVGNTLNAAQFINKSLSLDVLAPK